MKLPEYPKYIKCDVAWLRRLPSHWELRRIRWSVDGCQNGVWGDDPDGVEDIACIRVADFDRENGMVCADNLTYRSVDPRYVASRMIKRGDLLLEKSGGGEKQLVGFVALFDHEFDAVCSNFVARMPVSTGLPPRFWRYVHAALYAGRLNYPAIKQTTGIQNIESYYYLNTFVGFPPIAEQQQIADFLDWKTGQIDRLIAKKRSLLAALAEQRMAVITSAVTRGLDPTAPLKESGIPWLGKVPKHWEVRRLKFNISKANSGVTPKGGAESYELEGIPLLRSQNIYVDGLRLDDVVFISEETHAAMINSQVTSGDVLVNITGASIGRCNFVPDGFGEANVNQHVCIVRPESTMRTEFLYHVLASKVGQTQIDLEQGGSGREGLNFAALKNFAVPVPSTDEQREIERYIQQQVTRFTNLASKTAQAIDRLTEYRTALITAATTGKIDVREVVVPVLADGR